MAVAMERVYENQKIENILNLAMDATPAERERSPELETGYDQEAGTWELIIKYSRSLEAAAPLAEEITELLNECHCQDPRGEDSGISGIAGSGVYREAETAFF